MALPIIASAAAATSFEKTVAPYLSQLSVQHIQPLLTGDVAPLDWYMNTNPVVSGLLMSLVITLLSFIAQEINRNWSEVDRLWSILPVFYIGHFTLYAHLAEKVVDTQRLDTLFTLVTLWGARLTYNFYRKGGYSIGSEDYRHEILREKHIPKVLHTIWSFTFLALFQNLLLFALSLPAYVFLLLGTIPPPLNLESFSVWDGVISQGLAGILLIEALSDQQQWQYQTAKAAYKKTGVVPVRCGFTAEDLERGFVVSGLWSWSRHPNFACEQAIWAGIYQWTCAVTDVFANWTALGAVTLLLLFQGSVAFSESVSAAKYPEYKEYQKVVAKFVPGVKSFVGRKDEPVARSVKAPAPSPASGPVTRSKSGRKGGRKEL